MQNFVFQNPTKIIFGTNTIKHIGEETAAFGNKALLVSGKNSSRKSGVYDQVQQSLKASGLAVIEHSGVRSNPVLNHVHEGIQLAKNNKVEVIVAVGGGSVVDSAKAISAGACAEHDVWKFFIGKKSVKKALPLTCVLTLAASGSEMNSGMVITNEEKKQKFGFANKLLYPMVSILDPTVTYTVPPDYTSYGAVDAIAHVLEYYFTTEDSHTPVQDRFMEGLVINAMESCDQALKNPNDYQGRANLMWSATLALNGLTGAGLGKVGFPMHMIEHSLSAFYDIAHGAGLSVVIPGWMKWKMQTDPTKFVQFAERVFHIVTGSDSEKAAAGIAHLEKWFQKINSPTSLSEADIPEKDIQKIAENAVELGKIWRMRKYDAQTIEEILALCK